jgi:hypothetical protein
MQCAAWFDSCTEVDSSMLWMVGGIPLVVFGVYASQCTSGLHAAARINFTGRLIMWQCVYTEKSGHDYSILDADCS